MGRHYVKYYWLPSTGNRYGKSSGHEGSKHQGKNRR